MLTYDAEGYQRLLARLNACQEARDAAVGKSMAEVWNTCERPDWMFWLLDRSSADIKLFPLIAVEIAESVEGECQEAKNCNAVTRRFLAGNATIEELDSARACAWASDSARARASASARASAWASDSASRARVSARASASARACAWASDSASRARVSACSIIRKHVSAETLATLFEETI